MDIWSTALTHPDAFGDPPPRYGANSGTSFAAPFASGVAGLMLARRPDLDAGDIAPLMRAEADDIEAPGPDSTTGAGRLDAWGALAEVGSDRAIVHGVAAARVVALAHDTLALGEPGQPLMDALGRRAAVARLTVLATAPVPDSLETPVRAWVRVAQSATLRDTSALDWLAPWATVTAIASDSIRLRGTVYRIEDARVETLGAIDTATRWLPAPAESARIAYTIWGRSRPSPSAVGPSSSARPHAGRLTATPNPFSRSTRVCGPPGALVAVYDVCGRRVRVLRLSPGGAALWDGHDATGHEAANGLYLLRGAGAETGRIVRIE